MFLYKQQYYAYLIKSECIKFISCQVSAIDVERLHSKAEGSIIKNSWDRTARPILLAWNEIMIN